LSEPGSVLVVGAGPTGLLLAAELQRRGVRCHVIDAHAAPLHWDRATVVHPRSLEVFESLGIDEPFLRDGVKQRRACLHADGGLLGEIDLAICGSRYGFNIGLSEEVTENILNDYLQRQGGAVQRGSRLVDLVDRQDGFLAMIECDGATEPLPVQWVVGCDGLHSTTRELAGIDLAGHDIAEPWAVFDVTLDGWSQSYEGNYAYLDEVPVILTALPGQRWRAYLRPTGPDSDLVADARRTLARYLPDVCFVDVATPTRFHCHTKVAERFRAGRVLLAGDAAHVCSPAQGHGMNSGLQDAFNLAWKLALVCQGRCDASLLDSYEVERRPVAHAITASGDAAEQAHTLRDVAERRARDASLRATLKDPSARHHEAIAEAELDIDYRTSPIVGGDAHPLLGPGARLPDTIAVDLPGGGRRGLHELAFRAGHTALLIGGSPALEKTQRRLEQTLTAREPALVECVVAVGTRPDHGFLPHLDATIAERYGLGALTLLVIRPDGHVGLRAERDHAAALVGYHARLGAA
jgi:2-polyprenyl-6-methoxyphenol hydroxylase-like FAD-dependent oxidoreductase